MIEYKETISIGLEQPFTYHFRQNPLKNTIMTNKELLIDLASDLLKELEANKDDHFSLGSDQRQMKNSEVIKEIKSLTPLGKEILANWFSGIKSNLEFLHRNRLNPL